MMLKKIIIGTLLVSTLFACNKSDTTNTCKTKVPVDSAKFVKVIDGDTITVVYQGVTSNVRLIGIDTPESKKNAKAKSDAKAQKVSVDEIIREGKLASKFTSSLLNKKDELYLEFDKTPKDKYGRWLAYIYSNNQMINSVIISEGYAKPMPIKPNVKYASEFKKQYDQAVKEKKGLWK